MPTDTPEIELEGSVTANGDAAQVYFPKEYTQQYGFPLEPGDDFCSFIVPGEAIVLVPAPTDREYPLEFTVRSPESYRLTIDQPTTSMSQTTTEPDSPDPNPGGETDQ